MNVVVLLLQNPDVQSEQSFSANENGKSPQAMAYCKRVEQLLKQVGASARVQIFYSEAERSLLMSSWMTQGRTFISQQSQDRHQRLKSAVAFALLSGAEKLMVVKEDFEFLDEEFVDACWKVLEHKDVVAGRSGADCFCIGINNTNPGLLLDVDWLGGCSYSALCRKASQLGTCVHKLAPNKSTPECEVNESAEQKLIQAIVA